VITGCVAIICPSAKIYSLGFYIVRSQVSQRYSSCND
jgi:hypothetical protein